MWGLIPWKQIITDCRRVSLPLSKWLEGWKATVISSRWEKRDWNVEEYTFEQISRPDVVVRFSHSQHFFLNLFKRLVLKLSSLRRIVECSSGEENEAVIAIRVPTEAIVKWRERRERLRGHSFRDLKRELGWILSTSPSLPCNKCSLTSLVREFVQ